MTTFDVIHSLIFDEAAKKLLFHKLGGGCSPYRGSFPIMNVYEPAGRQHFWPSITALHLIPTSHFKSHQKKKLK